ncbi:MAG: hypothetical protein QOI38_23 [Sphingomonadales bacterium]|jgi:hypothetical protein|nr:hypothetical protein [Sphingomonadales bacterium]
MAGGTISGGAEPSGGGKPRRLWKAGLAGHVVMTTIVWATILLWLAYDNARLDDGHAFEADGAVRPPDPFTSEWLANAGLAYGRIALLALAYAIPLMLFLPHFERVRPGGSGALAGAAAALPLALAWATIAALSAHVIPWATFAGPALLLLLSGAAGGVAAARVRNGPGR